MALNLNFIEQKRNNNKIVGIGEYRKYLFTQIDSLSFGNCQTFKSNFLFI